MPNEIESGLIALASGKLALDMLGPSAKLAGHELKGYTAAGLSLLRSLMQKAERRRRDLRLRPGKLSPRVFHALLHSASVGDDEVMQAYFSGVLCSSFSRTDHDDRAVSFIRLVEGLSTYALRAHCIMYSSVALQQDHRPADVKKWLMRGNGITLAFDERLFRKRMRFARGEDQQALLEHAFISLSAANLCMQGIRPSLKTPDRPQFRSVQLTIRGAELFCWANGFGQKGVAGFFSERKPSAELRSVALKPAKLELGLVSYMTG